MTDADNGGLNPFGVNCLRNFPIFGTVVWGARTMRGADVMASQWKYIPVRRMALYIEQSLFAGLQVGCLRAERRAALGADPVKRSRLFMQALFRQGAFQGSTPQQAYFVQAATATTTTQDDINAGVVNIVVGFAPLKPAEFVVIHHSADGRPGRHLRGGPHG